jgi:cytochrome oxidase Cu insertion factor (SCO1/SenC/PrrC family)
MSADMTTQQPRRIVLVMALLFLAPVAVAFYLYYASNWRPGGQVNRGELVTPARSLPSVVLLTADGRDTGSGFLRGQWTLVYVGDGACDARCRTALYTIRQVRLALGEKMERVQRAFLYRGSCCDQAFFETEHSGLLVANLDSPGGEELLRAFPDTGPALAEHIYVVDPLGNLMMRYESEGAAADMIKDLKRLLKLSHIG